MTLAVAAVLVSMIMETQRMAQCLQTEGSQLWVPRFELMLHTFKYIYSLNAGRRRHHRYRTAPPSVYTYASGLTRGRIVCANYLS